MTQTIAMLRPTETIRFDEGTLAAFCSNAGTEAESAITHHLSQIEMLIDLVGAQSDHPEGLTRSCTDLRDTAARIGMASIQNGAEAVLECLKRGDRTALAACTARLIRLGGPMQSGGWVTVPQPDTVA